MTRGPLPIVAIRQAIKNAAARGTVMDRDLLRQSRIEFILFCARITIFVRVRRSPLHILSPEDCAANFKADILWLRRVPLTEVTARELWLLNPWGTWQYFRIQDDRVIEIRADGVPLLSDGAGIPVVAPVREDVPKASPGPASGSSGSDTRIRFFDLRRVIPSFRVSGAIRACIGLRFPLSGTSRPDSFGPFLGGFSGISRYCPGLADRRFCAENNRRVCNSYSGGSGLGTDFRFWGCEYFPKGSMSWRRMQQHSSTGGARNGILEGGGQSSYSAFRTSLAASHMFLSFQ